MSLVTSGRRVLLVAVLATGTGCGVSAKHLPASYGDPRANEKLEAAKDELQRSNMELRVARVLEVLGGAGVATGTGLLVADAVRARNNGSELDTVGATMLATSLLVAGAGVLLELDAKGRERRSRGLALQAQRLEKRSLDPTISACSDKLASLKTSYATVLNSCVSHCERSITPTTCRKDPECTRLVELENLIRDSAWCSGL